MTKDRKSKMGKLVGLSVIAFVLVVGEVVAQAQQPKNRPSDRVSGL